MKGFKDNLLPSGLSSLLCDRAIFRDGKGLDREINQGFRFGRANFEMPLGHSYLELDGGYKFWGSLAYFWYSRRGQWAGSPRERLDWAEALRMCLAPLRAWKGVGGGTSVPWESEGDF